MALFIPAALAGIQAAYGAYQTIEANRMARKNKRTDQVIQNEYLQNLRKAEEMARTGLPQSVYNQAQRGIDRNAAIGLNFLKSTGNRNQAGKVANIVSTSNTAQGNLDAADAQAMLANERAAMNARNLVGQAKDRTYAENAAGIAALKGAGIQNIGGSLNNLSTAAILNGSDPTKLLEFLKRDSSKKYIKDATKLNFNSNIDGITDYSNLG